ncbi:MAG: phage integrase N-terminal SAM-like domain-containing protein [Desulfobacterales bacterium]
MDEIREVMRLHHYSIHTERSYGDWIKRFIRFHKMKSRDDLKEGDNVFFSAMRGGSVSNAAYGRNDGQCVKSADSEILLSQGRGENFIPENLWNLT